MAGEQGAVAAIHSAAKELKLPTFRAQAEPLAASALKSGQSYLEYLAELLTREVEDRQDRKRARRIAEAKFPRLKRLADFDFTESAVKPAVIAALAKGAYLESGEPVIFLGDSGTGKTHLLLGLGLAACEMGMSVRYTTCAKLVNELVEAADERALQRAVARYGRYDLLCLDEVGYIHTDVRGAELLFQIITEREEKASIALATNFPFTEWGTVFSDPRLASAVVDRVTFKATIIETGTNSYRLRTSKAKMLN